MFLANLLSVIPIIGNATAFRIHHRLVVVHIEENLENLENLEKLEKIDE